MLFFLNNNNSFSFNTNILSPSKPISSRHLCKSVLCPIQLQINEHSTSEMTAHNFCGTPITFNKPERSLSLYLNQIESILGSSRLLQTILQHCIWSCRWRNELLITRAQNQTHVNSYSQLYFSADLKPYYGEVSAGHKSGNWNLTFSNFFRCFTSIDRRDANKRRRLL